MPQDAYSSSGLTDTMAPGTLSKLSLSQAVAFRVNFDGTPPPHEQMYWRGPVLWDFDGVTWSAGIKHATDCRNWRLSTGRLTTPSPWNRTTKDGCLRWICRPGFPFPMSSLDDFQVESREPVTCAHPLPGAFTAGLSRQCGEAPFPTAARPGTAAHHSIRARASWRQNGAPPCPTTRRSCVPHTPISIAKILSTRWSHRCWATNGMDDFLFETRKGFCEHYASSFVFLMRAAGIPARVVTGYQGGEFNALGGYTIVRQADAHAWAEVWLARRGWVRVDPTAAISPERVQSGLSAAVPDSAALPFLARTQSPLAAQDALQSGHAQPPVEPVGAGLQHRAPVCLPHPPGHGRRQLAKNGASTCCSAWRCWWACLRC